LGIFSYNKCVSRERESILSNDLKSVLAIIYAGLVYIAFILSFITHGTIFPDNPLGWLIDIKGIIIAPILFKYYGNKAKEEASVIRNEKLESMDNVTKQILNFDCTQKYYSFDENTQFLVDEEKKKIAIIINNHPKCMDTMIF
jgi:hypothetical protein